MKVTEKSKKIIHTVSDIVISLMLAVTGILFGVSCWSIYSAPRGSLTEQIFTPEKIGEAFGKIAPVVWITLVLVAVSAVLAIVFPREEAKLRSPKRAKTLWQNLSKRTDLTKVHSATAAKIIKERKLRLGFFIANIVIVAFEAGLPLIYLLNPANYTQSGDHNEEVLRIFLTYLVMLIPLLAYEIAYFSVTRFSYARESELLKSAMKAGAVRRSGDAEAPRGIAKIKCFFETNEKPIKLGVQIAFAGCAVIFVIVGAVGGGAAQLLANAVAICAACIGLG